MEFRCFCADNLIAQVVLKRQPQAYLCLGLPSLSLMTHGGSYAAGNAAIACALEKQYLAFG